MNLGKLGKKFSLETVNDNLLPLNIWELSKLENYGYL